jgi:hypothetical protein
VLLFLRRDKVVGDNHCVFVRRFSSAVVVIAINYTFKTGVVEIKMKARKKQP